MGEGFLTARDKFRLVPMRDGGRPFWRQIEETLLADIAHGVYPPDSQLPSEMELAQRFDVNRHTVRRALAALSQRGVLLVDAMEGQSLLATLAVGLFFGSFHAAWSALLAGLVLVLVFSAFYAAAIPFPNVNPC